MMRRTRYVLLLVTLICGCHTPDPSIDLLEGELRWMEDQLYMLEDELQEKCDQLAAYQAPGSSGTASSPSFGAGSSSRSQGSSSRTLDSNNGPIIRSPDEPTPADHGTPDRPRDNDVETLPRSVSEPDAEEFSAPMVEIPEGMTTDDADEAPEPEPLRGEPPVLESAEGASAVERIDDIRSQSYLRSRPADEVDADVSHILLQAQWNDGRDFDGQPTEDGLLIVVEPRNVDGQFVEIAGDVSIVVLDASQEGDDARVGRWDFDAAQVRRQLRKSALGRGIHLDIIWPELVAPADNLHVFARYVAVDGRKLETDARLQRQPSNGATGQWTPASRGRSELLTHDLAPSKPSPVIEPEDGLVRRPSAIPLRPIPKNASGPVSVWKEPASQSQADHDTARPNPVLPVIRKTEAERPTWQPYR